MSERLQLDCDAVDELDAAMALDAITPDERRAIAEHLEGCPRPHQLVRSLLGFGVALASALEPVPPSPGLRERVLRSAAATAQDHRPSGAPADAAAPRRPPEPAVPRGWLAWLSPGLARGMAAAGVAAAVVLAVWNVTLQTEVSEADRITIALAEASAVYPVTGEAGQGLLLDTPDGPRFLAARLETPAPGSLYELWLIGADGVPVDVGVVTDADGVALVPLEEDLAGYVTFAVTLETARVDAPTTTPVLVADIGDAGSGS
jgi:anti-sigma-K factor RskA